MASDVAFVTLCFGDLDIEAYWNYIYPNLKSYSEKYSIDLVSYNEKIKDVDRYPNWQKILALIENIDDYDWLIWFDADIMVMNHKIDVRSYINNDYNLITMENPYIDSGGVSTGFFFLRGGCEWSKKFLKDVFYGDNKWAQNPYKDYHEQSAVEHVAKKDKFNEEVLVYEDYVLGKLWPKKFDTT